MTTLYRIAMNEHLCRQIADPPGWNFFRWREERQLVKARRQLEVAAIRAEAAKLEAQTAQVLGHHRPAFADRDRPVAPAPLGKTDEATVLIAMLGKDLGRPPELREVQERYPDIPKTTAHRALRRVS